MSLIPDFEIGIWNAWFITIYFLLVGMLPGFLSMQIKPRSSKIFLPITRQKNAQRLRHMFSLCQFLPCTVHTSEMVVDLETKTTVAGSQRLFSLPLTIRCRNFLVLNTTLASQATRHHELILTQPMLYSNNHFGSLYYF